MGSTLFGNSYGSSKAMSLHSAFEVFYTSLFGIYSNFLLIRSGLRGSAGLGRAPGLTLPKGGCCRVCIGTTAGRLGLRSKELSPSGVLEAFDPESPVRPWLLRDQEMPLRP